MDELKPCVPIYRQFGLRIAASMAIPPPVLSDSSLARINERSAMLMRRAFFGPRLSAEICWAEMLAELRQEGQELIRSIVPDRRADDSE